MRYVIIGNSAAGIGAVEGIRQLDGDGEITIVASEPHHTYSRPLISYYLLGKADLESLKYRGDTFYTDNNCKLLARSTATGIDHVGRRVMLDSGDELTYDKLLVATGSVPFIPPFEGLDAIDDKHTFMSLDDALRLERSLDPHGDDGVRPPTDGIAPVKKHVLIIGAGLIGLKCAEGIHGRAGMITVLDLAPRVLSSILDEDGARPVMAHLESSGINFRLSCSVKRFERRLSSDAAQATDGEVLGGCPYKAVLDSGEGIDFDILVLAVGVRPGTSLLQGIADIDKGIVINERSETTASGIYAAGDCTQALDVSSGQGRIMALLPNAYMQGECAGIQMAGGDKVFDKALPMNAIGFFGLHITTAGSYVGDVYESNRTVNGETKDVSYKRLYYRDNRLNGYILIGDVAKAGIYTSLIRERTPLDSIDFELICEQPGLMAFTKEDRMQKLGK